MKLIPDMSGRVSLLRSSFLGVQVVAELSEERDVSWRKTLDADSLHELVEAIVLEELRRAGWEGGHADPTARQAGRFIRRPGPRISRRDRQPWMARVVYITGGTDGND